MNKRSGHFNYNFILKLGMRNLEVNLQTDAKTIAIQAPSGSGKTTLIKTIAGINKKFTGIAPQKTRVGYVSQDSLLIPTLSVQENLLLSPFADPTQLMKVSQDLKIDHLLGRMPRMLSGGERQRVAIGRALLCKAELLLLDEPFSALDSALQDQVIQVLKKYQQQNQFSLILVSHATAPIQALCQETWVIQDLQLIKYN